MSAAGVVAILFGIFLAFLTLTPSKLQPGKSKGQIVWDALQTG